MWFEIPETINSAPLYKSFHSAIENHWCVRISCRGCCAFHFRQELFTAMQISLKNLDEKHKHFFPYSLRDTQWEEREEKRIFIILDQWLDFIWDTNRFDQHLKKQLFLYKAEKYARELVGDIENLQDNNPFWDFVDSLAPHWSYSSLAHVKEAKYLKKNMIKDAKWLLLSGIETLTDKFETRRANHLNERLQGFEAEHPDIGWQFRHSERRRSANPSGIPYARRNQQIKKRQYLEQFGQLSDLDKLKTIAKPDFEYRLEFIPVEMIPNIDNVQKASAMLSQKERQKLLDWIGQKSGTWGTIRSELQKPFLVKSGDEFK